MACLGDGDRQSLDCEPWWVPLCALERVLQCLQDLSAGAAYQRSCISTRAANRFKSFSSVLASSCARILCVFAEAVFLMRRRHRSMQQRRVSSLVSADRCHVYTCHTLPCDGAGAAAQSSRRISGAFAERPPCCSGHTHTLTPQPARTKLSVFSHAPVIATACCLAALPPNPLPLVCVAASGA